MTFEMGRRMFVGASAALVAASAAKAFSLDHVKTSQAPHEELTDDYAVIWSGWKSMKDSKWRAGVWIALPLKKRLKKGIFWVAKGGKKEQYEKSWKEAKGEVEGFIARRMEIERGRTVIKEAYRNGNISREILAIELGKLRRA